MHKRIKNTHITLICIKTNYIELKRHINKFKYISQTLSNNYIYFKHVFVFFKQGINKKKTSFLII